MLRKITIFIPVPETWMSQTEMENLAAFVLRAAQKAPDWENTQFDL